MQAIDYQPRLTTWSHVWRFVVMVAISAGGWFELAVWQWENDRRWFAIDLAIGLLCFAAVTQRRRHPVGVALFTNVIGAVSGSASGPAVLATVSVATRRRWREIIPVALVSLASAVVLYSINPATEDPLLLTLTIVVAAIAVAVGWGMYIGSRRELLATLRERAETAESEQAARVAQARTAERSRIAREMHDVLAHRISLVTMHAGALSYRTDLTPEQVRETADIIQDSSHQALAELRQVLGVLREDPGDADPERPQPSAEDLPGLIEEARATGMNVVMTRGRPVADVPEGIGRDAYRIVQEALTNARKHAPDTLVTVDVRGRPGEGLNVEVRNPLRVGAPPVLPESGLGLVGLTERTALAGGHLRHEVTSEGEFTLTAWLPWPA
ncbi:sensor histidine kinase [Aeromicrobium sp.]|uniref:sensor histidine kinase n=1 Tax=Aeromicrobium sp. TaxID=1871063 RepID=UPI003D6C0F92